MLARRIVTLVLICVLKGPALLYAQDSVPIKRSYTVGVLSDNYPYAYVPESQTEPVGFSVELLQAINRIVPLELRTIVGTTPDIHAKFFCIFYCSISRLTIN